MGVSHWLPGYKGGRIVFTNGCFDLLHDGHRHLLKEARRQGAYLVVGLNSDESIRRRKGPGRPVDTLEERVLGLSSIGLTDDPEDRTPLVDYIEYFDDDTPVRLLREIRPDVYVLGEEYRGRCPGAEFAGRVHFVERLPGLSTTRIVKAMEGN